MTRCCKHCGDEMEFDSTDNEVVCGSCGTKHSINTDADFVDGMWKDLTAVSEIL